MLPALEQAANTMKEVTMIGHFIWSGGLGIGTHARVSGGAERN